MKVPSKKSIQTPQELLKEYATSRSSFTVGIPRERRDSEKRLVFTPEAVDMLTQAGHRVFLEEGAGSGVRYSDTLYSESGARICTRNQVFDCDLIVKITPPTPEEIGLMKKKATICSMLQLPDISQETISAMVEKSLNAVGYELMTDGVAFPVRNSISEIEGAASISVASEFLSNDRGGKGLLMGGIPGVSPTEVVIIGAGRAGTVAAKAALALGAVVKVFDSHIGKLRNIQNNLGINIFTSVLQPNVLMNAFKSADVVIGAMRFINDPVRYVITEEVTRSMKKGALIIDLRINQGGCFETSCFLPEGHPAIFEKYGVVHYCIPNLSSRVARTTSMALSNIFLPLLLQMGEAGGITGSIKSDLLFRSGHYMYCGKLVNSYVAKQFNLTSHDIGLFLSAF